MIAPEPAHGRSLPVSLLDRLLRWSPAQPMFERLSARRLRVLAYHGVDDPAQFERHMAHLRRTTRPVALEQLLRGPASPLPPGATLVTFDDGRPSVLQHGVPALTRHRIPAVVFVVAGVIDTHQPFWWDEVAWLHARGARIPGLPDTIHALVGALKRVPDEVRREHLDSLRAALGGQRLDSLQLTSEDLRALQSAGVEVGNHSLTHPILEQCSPERLELELCEAHERLTRILGRPPVAFAYPNGDLDPRADAILSRLGYRLVFGFDHRVNPPALNPRAVSRLRVDSTASMDRFRLILSGLHPFVHARRGLG